MGEQELVRPSRDGDQFHYHWAARHCLALLPGTGDLVAVSIEGASVAEGEATVDDGDELIDVGLYYGSEVLKDARLAHYVQLKHSTRHAGMPWTASRMLIIATRTMPTSSTLPRDRWLDREQRATLRDALHTWAFCHVDDIARAYVQTSPNKSVRAEEIFAPLRVVASLSDSEQWRFDVERALGKGRSADVSSADVMKEAILGILIRSITGAKRLRTVLTVTEVKMHMQLLKGGRFGKSSTTEIADIESPVWIGRQFRQVFGRDDAERPRFRMYGHFVRAWAIHPTLLDQAVAQGGVPQEELIETDDPQEFCQVCATCDYGALCEIRSSKEPREAPLELRKAGRKAVGNRAGPDAGLH